MHAMYALFVGYELVSKGVRIYVSTAATAACRALAAQQKNLYTASISTHEQPVHIIIHFQTGAPEYQYQSIKITAICEIITRTYATGGSRRESNNRNCWPLTFD